MQLNNVEDIYKLSPTQQGLLFHTLYDQAGRAYFQQLVYTLRGALDATAFWRAWQQVVDRHPALRTAFLWQDMDEPLQVVRQQVALPWAEHDWRAHPANRQRELLEAILDEQRGRGFDLRESPLMNCTLIHATEDTHWFIWNHHHIILDAWSVALVLGDVFAHYDAFRRRAPLALESPPHYRDYIAWLQQQDLAAAAAFWRQTLQGFAEPTMLPGAKAAAQPMAGPGDWANQSVTLSTALTAELVSLAQRHHLTLNTLVRSAWALLLSRSSDLDDIVFGATTSGRPAALPGVEAIVGLFINTMPVRVRVPRHADLLPWLHEIQAQQTRQEHYAYSPLVEVHGWSDVPRGTPLFESLLVFENAPANSAAQVEQSGLTIADIRYDGRTNYPLTIGVVPGTELLFDVQYAADRFDSDVIARMIGHLQAILQAMAANPHRRLGDLPWMTQAEYRQIVVEWNANTASYPAPCCLHDLFARRAAGAPDAVAVVCEGAAITYAALDRRANQLAHHLRALGIGPEARVVICMDRSLDLVVGLLGILKAGGAYVPFDPTYPLERLAYILEDTQAPLIVTQRQLAARLPQSRARIVCLDADRATIANESAENPAGGVTAENLAYVIYTSGSSGRPKGVGVCHRSVVNLAAGLERAIYGQHHARQLRVSLNGPLAFDTSVKQIIQLLYGHTLCIIPGEIRFDPHALRSYIEKHALDVFDCTPSQLRLLVADGLLESGASAPGSVLIGGEAIDQGLWRVLAHSTGRTFYNLYGPTECTVDATVCRIQAPTPTIGRPIANTQVYLLDRYLQPVPVGVAGELYVGGAGVARGYLGRPDLTAERFIPNPFGTMNDEDRTMKDAGAVATASSFIVHRSSFGARLYRTGDLARFLPSGEIEYLGRVDHQVKLRGFRVELGEIESVLRGHPAVREALLLAREDTPGDQRLVAYLVMRTEGRGLSGADSSVLSPQSPALSGGEGSVLGALRAFLQTRLPDYMVPSAFVLLDRLPLTPNGKIDRRALPAPGTARPELEATFVAPRGFVEEELAAMWRELLQIDRVGVEDNFFVLGGHSLLLMRLASRIHETFDVDLPLRLLFESPTVVDMSRAIAQRLIEDADPEEFNELLQEVHALSPDELGAMLEAETD